jgi:hypothetical protein
MSDDLIHRFPHICSLGTPESTGVFDSTVEITEKIDGSTFAFGKICGKLHMRTNSQQVQLGQHPDQFREAVLYAHSVQDKIPDNVIYYGEYLRKPRHNALCYERIPANHIMVFGVVVGDRFIDDYDEMRRYADLVGLETVPLLYSGIADVGIVENLLDRKSVLGKVDIEGVVIKNYATRMYYKGHEQLQFVKYVSDSFREVRKAGGVKKDIARLGSITGTDNNLGILGAKIQALVPNYITDARCEKVIQHLYDAGSLELSMTDFPVLMKELDRDFRAECTGIGMQDIVDLLGDCEERNRPDIANKLWNDVFSRQVVKGLQRKMVNIYKNWLAHRND